MSDSDKGKDTAAVIVDFLCNHRDDPVAVHDILWSNGLSSEFKNKFKVKILQSLSLTHKRLFLSKSLLQIMGKESLMKLVAKLSLWFV